MICSKLKKTMCSVAISSLIMGAFSGCSILPKEETVLAPPLVAPKKQEYNLYKVVKGTIEDKLTGGGVLISASQSEVYFKDSAKRIKHINVKVGDTVKQGDILAETEVGEIESQIKIQEYNVKLNEIDYNDMKAKVEAMGICFEAEAGSQSDIEKMRLRLLIEQTRLDNLKAQQQASRLTAPISGQVVYVENIKAGEVVDTYKKIVTVGDPQKLMVYCDAEKLKNLSLGMKAVISINGTKADGIITSNPKSSENTKDEDAKKGIILKVLNMPTGAKINDLVSLEVVLATKTDTLVVPKSAVKVLTNTYSVQVWDGTIKKEVEVQLGLQTTTEAEIVSGLNEGQNIIVN